MRASHRNFIATLLCGSLSLGAVGVSFAQLVPPSTPDPFSFQFTPNQNRAADELLRISTEARSAAANGNCVRLHILRGRLNDIRREPNHGFWKTYGLDRTSLVERIPIHQILEAYVGRLYALQCPPPQQPKVEVAIDAGGQLFRLPKRFFLGTEIGGVPRVELFSPSGEPNGPNLSGSLKIDTSAVLPQSTHLKIGFSYDKADVKQEIGRIDPGAGNLLLIPGPLGGTSGFSLGAYPLNIVENAQYVTDIMRYALQFELGQEREGRSQTEVYGGYTYLRYAHTEQNEKFLGSIPGFARDFLYSSQMSVDEFNFRLGIFFQALLWQSPLGQLILRAYVEAGPDFARAFARDTLSFTGFPDSTANPTASKTDIGYAAGLRLSVRPTTNTEIAGEFRFEERTGLPVIVRDGTNPSKLEIGRYSAAIFRLGAKIRF